MANVNFQQGLKNAGDRVSGVAGAVVAVGAMGFDDKSGAFATTDTAHNTGGAPTNFFGKALDGAPTGGAAASPYIVSHVCTLAAGEYNQRIRRAAIHFKATAPVVGDATLGFGIDGLDLLKAATFALVTTFKLSYS